MSDVTSTSIRVVANSYGKTCRQNVIRGLRAGRPEFQVAGKQGGHGMINRATPRTITAFRGAYNWLSNFYQTPVVLDQITYLSAEHAFQAEKTSDMNMRRMIAAATTSAEAKRLGRAVNLIDGWIEYRRYDAMTRVISAKFSHGSQLGSWLLSTGSSTLVEGNNWHDGIWGQCFCGRCSEGCNILGWILMQRRRRLGGK